MTELAYSAAAERNKQAILTVLRTFLPPRGVALEIGCGTGQHVAWFGANLPQWTWEPTDLKADLFPDIMVRIGEARLGNVLPPRLLNVLGEAWRIERENPDLIYCANMLHIAPWSCCAGLMRGAARHLAAGGRLVTYGPCLEDDVSTSEGNLKFDAALRDENPDWGIRRREAVEQVAHAAGLQLAARHAMPANNLLLVWKRAD
jgi:SAM-dependent methyltransferase